MLQTLKNNSRRQNRAWLKDEIANWRNHRRIHKGAANNLGPFRHPVENHFQTATLSLLLFIAFVLVSDVGAVGRCLRPPQLWDQPPYNWQIDAAVTTLLGIPVAAVICLVIWVGWKQLKEKR